MRTFLTILFLWVFTANATNYYVDTTGNDSNNGLTTATAWKTIFKVNAFSNTTGFVAGDSILFKSGQTWVDTLRVHSAGSAGSPIVFASYGTGNKPVISAFYQVPNSLWSDSSHIWSATVSNSVPQLNTVMIDGKLRAKGRYPNTGYMSNWGYALSQLKIYNYGTPHLTKDYSGGQIVFREYGWIIDNPFIDSTRGTGDTMYLRTPLTYNIQNVGYYFIENTPKVLDTTYEWAFDSSLKKLYLYSIDTPNVQISIFDTSVIASRKDYITFYNLHITGSNAVGVCADTSNHITVKNCVVDNTGGWYTDITRFGGGAGGAAIRGQAAEGLTIQSDSIINNLNNGVLAIHGCDTATINDNYVYNSGYLIGMGSVGNGSYIGVYQTGNKSYFTRNKVLNSGYHDIYFYGLNDTLYRNIADTFNLVKEDGGAIYTAACTCTGTLIRSNFTANGIGTFGSYGSAPIYIDNSSSGIAIDSNAVSGGRVDNIGLNGGSYIVVKNNNIVASNGRSIINPTSVNITHSDIKNNIFYSTTHSYPVYYIGTITTANNDTSDSNYVFRSSEQDSLYADGLTPTYYSLANIKTSRSLELHSQTMPSNYSNGVLYVNKTLADSTLSFTTRKIDAKGTVYFTNIALKPFQSIILFDFPYTIPKRVGGFLFE